MLFIFLWNFLTNFWGFDQSFHRIIFIVLYLKSQTSAHVQIVIACYCIRGGSRTAATSKIERFVVIVNGFQPLTIITRALHLGCCGSPRSAFVYTIYKFFDIRRVWNLHRGYSSINEINQWFHPLSQVTFFKKFFLVCKLDVTPLTNVLRPNFTFTNYMEVDISRKVLQTRKSFLETSCVRLHGVIYEFHLSRGILNVYYL